jgi:hypothetical protein
MQIKNITKFFIILIVIFKINISKLLAEVKIENVGSASNGSALDGSNNLQSTQDNSDSAISKLIRNSEIQIDKYLISEKLLQNNYGLSLAIAKDLKIFETNSSIMNKINSEIFYIKNLNNHEYNHINQIFGSRFSLQSNLLKTLNYNLKNFEIGCGGNILLLEYGQKSSNKKIAILPSISLVYHISQRLDARLNFLSSMGLIKTKSSLDNRIIINNLDFGLSINF